jgi:hypothetical protein
MPSCTHASPRWLTLGVCHMAEEISGGQVKSDWIVSMMSVECVTFYNACNACNILNKLS